MTTKPKKKRHRFVYEDDPDSRTCRDCGLRRRHPLVGTRVEWDAWEYETPTGWRKEVVVPTCPPPE